MNVFQLFSIYLFGLFAIYLLFSFAMAAMDISSWDIVVRAACAFIMALWSIVVCACTFME